MFLFYKKRSKPLPYVRWIVNILITFKVIERKQSKAKKKKKKKEKKSHKFSYYLIFCRLGEPHLFATFTISYCCAIAQASQVTRKDTFAFLLLFSYFVSNCGGGGDSDGNGSGGIYNIDVVRPQLRI